MISAIKDSFISAPNNKNYLILDNFDEHYLDEPQEYGIIGYSIIGQFHKIYFNSREDLFNFQCDYNINLEEEQEGYIREEYIAC